MTIIRKWFAVKGVPLRNFLYELRLVTREAGWDLDGKFPSEASGTRLESGWYLIIVKKEWDSSPDEVMLAKLSAAGEIVRCLVDEAKASSEAQGFRAGAKQWELRHDPAEGPAALQVSGTPPECLDAIRQRRLMAQPSDGPLGGGFGIPIDVCESLTGFRYNDLSTVTEPYSHLDEGWDSAWPPED